MGKKSPADMFRDIWHLRHRKRVLQLRPPYECPICEGTPQQRKPVMTKVKKLPQSHLIRIEIWCCTGCFYHVFQRRLSSSFQPIDAYSEVIDLLEKGMIGVTMAVLQG